MTMNKPLLGTKCVSLTLAGAGPAANKNTVRLGL